MRISVISGLVNITAWGQPNREQVIILGREALGEYAKKHVEVKGESWFLAGMKDSFFMTSDPDVWCNDRKAGSGWCQQRPFLSLKGSVFIKNKWKPLNNGVCGGLSLWINNADASASILNTCFKTWNAHIASLTYVKEHPPIRVQELKSFMVCYQGLGSVLVGRNEGCRKIITLDSLKGGTSALMDIHWLCGTTAYAQLPVDWKGLCSMVALHSTALIIPIEDLATLASPRGLARPQEVRNRHPLQKRSANNPLSSVADLLEKTLEYSLFNSTRVTFAAWLVPGIPTAATPQWLQSVRWDSMKLANITGSGVNALREELRGLRLTALQNRSLTDLLIANEERSCAKIGGSWCTFIPKDLAEEESLTLALKYLHDLNDLHDRNAVLEVEAGSQKDWLANLVPGLPPWAYVLIKIMIPVFIIIGMCPCCALGIRSLRKKKASKCMGSDMTVKTENPRCLNAADISWPQRTLMSEEATYLVMKNLKIRTPVMLENVDEDEEVKEHVTLRSHPSTDGCSSIAPHGSSSSVYSDSLEVMNTVFVNKFSDLVTVCLSPRPAALSVLDAPLLSAPVLKVTFDSSETSQ